MVAAAETVQVLVHQFLLRAHGWTFLAVASGGAGSKAGCRMLATLAVFARNRNSLGAPARRPPVACRPQLVPQDSQGGYCQDQRDCG